MHSWGSTIVTVLQLVFLRLISEDIFYQSSSATLFSHLHLDFSEEMHLGYNYYQELEKLLILELRLSILWNILLWKVEYDRKLVVEKKDRI